MVKKLVHNLGKFCHFFKWFFYNANHTDFVCIQHFVCNLRSAGQMWAGVFCAAPVTIFNFSYSLSCLCGLTWIWTRSPWYRIYDNDNKNNRTLWLIEGVLCKMRWTQCHGRWVVRTMTHWQFIKKNNWVILLKGDILKFEEGSLKHVYLHNGWDKSSPPPKGRMTHLAS